MTSRGVATAWALPALALLATCGFIGLIEPTETRYAEIAREMQVTGDWLAPRLNGILHFHKPPLAYWGAAAGMAAAGWNAWGARIFTALAAGFTLWVVTRLSRRLESDATAGVAPVVLASMVLFAALSRQVATDVPLMACTAWFWMAYLASSDRLAAGGARPSPWPFAALAVGFMTKGPIIFLHTLLPLLGVWAVRRADRPWAPLRSGRGWLLFALLGLPWYLYVVFRYEGLFAYFLREQMWARYATTVHQRSGPWYYFSFVLLVGALPWTFAALGEMTRRVRAGASRISFESAVLLSWAVLPAAFFSTAGSKLPAYVLPETLPVAILAAAALLSPSRLASLTAAIPLAALAVGIEWLGPRVLTRFAGVASGAGLPPAAHVAAALCVAASATLAMGRSRLGAWFAWGSFFVLIFVAAPYESVLGSPRRFAETIAHSRRPEEPLVEYGDFNAGLPFYLRTHATLVEVPRDLRFEGQDDSGQPPVRRIDDLVPLVRKYGRVWIFAKEGEGLRLAASLHLAAERVATWRGREVSILRAIE